MVTREKNETADFEIITPPTKMAIENFSFNLSIYPKGY